jgi:rubrerythrin
MNIPMVKVPTYTMQLPFTNREIKYRPYLVKEEKLLTMAGESENRDDILQAVGDIVKSCTFGDIDIEKDSMFEVQQVFLNIRGKSVGETIEFYSVCGNCEDKKTTTVSTNEFVLKTTPGHTNKIILDENFSIVMKYPTFKHFIQLYSTEEESSIYDVIAECIDTVYSEDEVFVNNKEIFKEMREFVDNLTLSQFEKLEHFFVSMPVIKYEHRYECEKCSFNNTLIIDGITNFFE